MEAAQQRAAAAEMSKIQLSMRLAELDDRGGAGGGGGAGSGSPLRSNEEGFAQSVMARRVSTGEQEAEELRRQLQASELIISQLEFQVGLGMSGNTEGGLRGGAPVAYCLILAPPVNTCHLYVPRHTCFSM